MVLDLDRRLRLAAFAHVASLRAAHGGLVPADRLREGLRFEGARVPLFNPGQGIHKPEVLGPDGAALTIYTSAKSPYEDSRDAARGVFIYKYQGTDPDNRHNRALQRAFERRLPLLYLHAEEPGWFIPYFPVFISGNDPAQLQVELSVDHEAAIALPWADASEETQLRRRYATRSTLYRLHQQQFSRRVIAAYRTRCAICQIGHKPLLDAAHILPDGDPRSLPRASNGLSLCKIHHSAYDANIMGVDADARVHVRPDILHEVDGPMLKHGLQELHGARLVLPHRFPDRPNADFLAERYEAFRAA